MSEHAPAGRRAVRSAGVWMLAITLAIAGCSAGSGNSTGRLATLTSSNSPAPTTPSSSPASSTSAAQFRQDPVDTAFAKKLDALCQDWNNFASYH